MMEDQPQSAEPDSQGLQDADSKSPLTHQGSKRQERKLLLLMAGVTAFGLLFALAQVSVLLRLKIVVFYALGAATLLLMAKYIVYSHKRDKSRTRGPYHGDHVIK